jgi:hypothetical protein
MSSIRNLEINCGFITKSNSVESFLTTKELKEIIQICKNQIQSYKDDGVNDAEIFRMNRDLLIFEISSLNVLLESNKNKSLEI